MVPGDFTSNRNISWSRLCKKKNQSLVFSGDRNNSNPRLHHPSGTRQASFPIRTLNPLVGIFLSALNTNHDGFYFSIFINICDCFAEIIIIILTILFSVSGVISS